MTGKPSADEKIGHEKYQRLIAAAQKETTVKVAVAHPCDDVSLHGAIEAHKLGLIDPILVGPPERIRNAARDTGLDIKKIVSPVAGRANVLVVPDLEAGNMLAKSLSFLAEADAAGIVLGARVPVILTSRADSLLTRLASCAVAVMVAAARRKATASSVL